MLCHFYFEWSIFDWFDHFERLTVFHRQVELFRGAQIFITGSTKRHLATEMDLVQVVPAFHLTTTNVQVPKTRRHCILQGCYIQ